MTPEAAANPVADPTITPPSTAGMTTRVVKGSLWTLTGQVLPLFASLVATPFVIRILGSEGYGVLILVSLIPAYFSFADFGMGVASTKYGSEAYGQGDQAKENRVVWTAVSIAAVSATAVALPIFIFSYWIVEAFKVPEHLVSQAAIALRIASVAFVLGILSLVLNTPMLARLRMDLNTITQAIPRILLVAVTPVVLYFGGGIVGAVSWSFIISVGTLASVIYLSGRLLPRLFRPDFDRGLIRPLLKFGGALLVASIAAVLLINLEKLFLTRMVSVQALAWYSVAFTFASMATLFTTAMIQSLIPAFSQLLAPEKRNEFENLFSRSIRLTLIWLLPMIMFLVIIARPFFTVWAGEEFGRESTPPFYLLVVGLFFNILAYIPHASITAVGRTDIFAKLYWIELVIYAIGAFLLINYLGILGAALAWSVRVALDAVAITWISRRTVRWSFRFSQHLGTLVLACLFLLPPVVLAFVFRESPAIFIPAGFVFAAVYSVFIWKRFVTADERVFITNRVRTLLKSTG